MNILEIMQKMKTIKNDVDAINAKLDKVVVEGSAGAGMVKVTMNGNHAATAVAIDDSVRSDGAMLEDLLTAAVNDAIAKADAAKKDSMASLMSSFGLPPDFKLPF